MNTDPASDPNEISEFMTRKVLIDKDLREAGWKLGVDWMEEFRLPGMPNDSDEGFADYVLFDDDGRPLAVVEAKRTSKDPVIGRVQAKLYADLLQNMYRRRPVIFMTNGYETRIQEPDYPERVVSGIYTKRDLKKLYNLMNNRSSRLSDASIDDSITNRYYQHAAIKAVCKSFENKHRKALLVMATGSGKTRTVMSLVDVMMRKNWIKNVLFLADRISLVSQAEDAFTVNMPSVSTTNICKSNYDKNARCVFSTYQTMYNHIDSDRDEDGNRLFSNGHFDLIIVDEAHRSVYNKYRDIFNYFDALLVGLTATPKDEIDKNTYEVFNLDRGEPTYAYDLSQAIGDGYLVDYRTVEVTTKFLQEGITYDELSAEERQEYEECFTDENGYVPERIENTKLNEWVFNRDTIVRVLDILMRQGHKVDSGSMIGKTIIFAKNHNHAEAINQVFFEEYPHYRSDFCQVVDYSKPYAEEVIRKFKINEPTPQIAISVDMLDTGIDVPEILNLVFFKKVYSKAKFWQMIGRGTRLCPKLIDGNDKENFLIFDFCSNFEFFRVNKNGMIGNECSTIQGRIFMVKAEMAMRLQDIRFQTEEFMPFRKELIEDALFKVRELNRDNFAVKQHLRHVDRYSKEDIWNGLDSSDLLVLNQEVAPLIIPYDGEIGAIRFDALVHSMELMFLSDSPKSRLFNTTREMARILSEKTTIPDITARMDVLQDILSEGYLEHCSVPDFEKIRKEIREIIKYLDKNNTISFNTHFIDTITSYDMHESDIQCEDLSSYREKAEHYIRENSEEPVIRKLYTNQPLDDEDIQSLENILWSELGTREEYEAEYGSKPLELLVREINGMDMNSAKAAFAAYLNDSSLDDKQIYFVNQIIEYIVRNGAVQNMAVLMESPFNDCGSIADIFTNLNTWRGIKSVIEDINNNAGL